MADRTCPKCSAPVLRDDQRFCEKCGHRLDSSEPTTAPTGPPKTQATGPPKKPSPRPAPHESVADKPVADKPADPDAPISIRRPFEPLADTDPTEIGRYQLLVRLGVGGFGTVYLGQDEEGGLAAVKVVHPGLAADPTFRDRFRREVELGMRVRSQFTTRFLAADIDAPQPWMATEFVDGPSLSEAVSKKPLDQNAVLAIAAGTIQALIDIHALGVIHRDLKPSNILLTETGPKIVDFGIARAGDQTAVTATGAVLGSPAFLSPEQVTSGEATEASDVFSWACSVCYAVSGQSPFGEGAPAALLYRVVQQDPEIPTLDGPLAGIVTEALSKNSLDRPGPRQIADRLGISAGSSDAAARMVQTNWQLPSNFFDPPRLIGVKRKKPAAKTGWKGWPAKAAALVLVAAGVGAAVFFANGSDDNEPTVANPFVEVPPDDEPEDSGASRPEGLVASITDAQNAVVRIEVSGSFHYPSEATAMDDGSSGSGFIIDRTGLAITNNHVVAGASSIQIFIGEEKTARLATLVARSECSDIALIDIDGGGYDYLNWHSGEVQTGEPIYAAGFPLGDPEFTLTRGIISKDQASSGLDTYWASLQHQIEHDARLNPGSSGGPLLTDDAAVIGVNYSGWEETDQSWAISVREVTPMLDTLTAGQDVYSIGVNGEAYEGGPGEPSGIWIISVQSGTPADELGLQPGDVVTHLENVKVGADGTMGRYCDILRSHQPDDVLKVRVYRTTTGETLEGRLNSVALRPTDSAEPSPAFDYTEIWDDTGNIVLEVPETWDQVDGVYATDFGPNIAASPDLNSFLAGWWNDGERSWDAPGVMVGATRDLFVEWGFEEVADVFREWGVFDSCTSRQTDDYEDSAYFGLWEGATSCGDNDATVALIVASPVQDLNAFTVFVVMQFVSDIDLDAAVQIAESFYVDPAFDSSPDLAPTTTQPATTTRATTTTRSPTTTQTATTSQATTTTQAATTSQATTTTQAATTSQATTTTQAATPGPAPTSSLPTTQPSEPRSVEAAAPTPYGDNRFSVNVTWRAPSVSGSASVKNYVVRFASNDGTTVTQYQAGKVNSYWLYLPENTVGAVSVAAVNHDGLQGSFSQAIQVVTGSVPTTTSTATTTTTTQPPIQLPSAPRNLVVQTSGTSNPTISIYWDGPATGGEQSSCQSSIYCPKYRIEQSADGGIWTRIEDGYIYSFKTISYGLTGGIQYTFRVAAINDQGVGPWGQASVTTAASTTTTTTTQPPASTTTTTTQPPASTTTTTTQPPASTTTTTTQPPASTTTTTTQPPSKAITTLDTGGVGTFSSIAVGSDGFFKIAYYDAANGDLKLTSCLNALCTSHGPPIVLADTGRTGLWPSMEIGADGYLNIAYFNDTEGRFESVRCTMSPSAPSGASCAEASYFGGATGPLADSNTISTAIGTHNSGGPVAASWYHDGKLMVGSVGAGPNGGPSTRIADPNPGSNAGAGPDMGQFSSIAVNQVPVGSTGWDSNPVVAYLDSDNGLLRVKKCADALCNNIGGRTASTLANTGPVTGSSQTSMEIPSSTGNPVISYFWNQSDSATQLTSGSLNVVACNDAECSSGETIELDSTGIAGQANSMALGANGFPVISYYDRSNQDLKLARCSNARCTAAVLSVEDSIGNSTTGTGHGTTSIAVAPDGRIGISYFDANVDTLKIAVLPAS